MPTEKQNIAYLKKQVKEYLEAAEHHGKLRSSNPENSVRYAAKEAGYRMTAKALEDAIRHMEGEVKTDNE